METNFDTSALANEIVKEYCKDIWGDKLAPDFKKLLIELNDRDVLHQIVFSVCCCVWLKFNQFEEEGL